MSEGAQHIRFPLHEQDSGVRMAGLFFSAHLTDGDLLDLAAARGLAFGVLGSHYKNIAESWFGEQYEVNQAALRDLGFKEGNGLGEFPSFNKVIQDLGIVSLMKLGRRHELGYQDNLVVCPSVQEVGVMGTKDEPGYVPRFDRKQGSAGKTGVDKATWGHFPDKGEVHDPADVGQWMISIVLDSESDLLEPESAYAGPEIPRGLLYTSMSSEDQRAMLKADQEDHDFGEDLRLDSVTLAHIILINAQRRIQGLPFLDADYTVTRLPQYDDVPVVGIPRILAVAAHGGALGLGKAETTSFPNQGIREAVTIVQPSETE